jgi:hypothetical protein
VYVIDGSVMFGLDDREPLVLTAGESFYEPPGALDSVSRNASQELPASLIAFFVLGEATARPSATVTDGRRRVFVAGAGGLIGVRRVPLLVGAGYDVAGPRRPPARVERLRFVTDRLDSEAA